MSSFAAETHGIQSHHSTSTSNTSTSSISISSSYSTPSASNHNNNLPPQNYQQSNLHHHHHNSNHSQFQSHQGQSPPLHYLTDLNNSEQPRQRNHHTQQTLVGSNDDGPSNIIQLSPSTSASEHKYLGSPSSSGSILPNNSHLPTSSIEQLGPMTPPATSGTINISEIGVTSASSVIQLPQTPEDPNSLHQQTHLNPQHVGHSSQHDMHIGNNHLNQHVSVHQRLAPTIQLPQHHTSNGGNAGSNHTLVAHQSGGGLIHTTSSSSVPNRQSNPSSPLDEEDDDNIDIPGDVTEGRSNSATDHGPTSGGGGR